jgi:hypothetical protein
MDKTIGIDALRDEHKEAVEWDVNPVKRTILSLLNGPLSNSNYRSLTRTSTIAIIEEALTSAGLLQAGKEMLQATRLLRKIKKAPSRDDVILVLGDYILQ